MFTKTTTEDTPSLDALRIGPWRPNSREDFDVSVVPGPDTGVGFRVDPDSGWRLE